MLTEKEIAQSYVAEQRYPLPLKPVMNTIAHRGGTLPIEQLDA